MSPPAPARRRRARRLPAFVSTLCERLVAAGAQQIYLFGSYARGEADADSDVDLVVIKNTALPFLDRLREAAASIDPDWPVDLLVYTPAEFEAMRRQGNAFAELVSEEGVRLYG
jgi:predicted nucleotidyltransferase